MNPYHRAASRPRIPVVSRRPIWILLSLVLAGGGLAANPPWPPALPGARDGTVTFTDPGVLSIPDDVAALRDRPDAVAFEVAQTAPRIALAYHGDLPHPALNNTGWSSWGDIAVAADGRVYSGIGDHGDDAGGKADALLYVWDPATERLKQIADVNRIGNRQPGQPAWAKIHARIDEGPDGWIYFSGTLNDGNRANRPEYAWNADFPGGQLYRYHPPSGEAEVFANLPAGRCTATSLLDRERNIWWCTLEAGGNALWGIDLATREPVFQGPDGSVVLNRNFALNADGAVYFNGPEGRLWRYDPEANDIAPTRTTFENSPGMRASTRPLRDGSIYGVTHRSNQLFRYDPAADELRMLGATFLRGDYTTVIEVSPCEQFLYYMPGAHGGAIRIGTPVVQYRIADGQHKVQAFLRDVMRERFGYVPGGTYGIKLSHDGQRLYVNLNGHAVESLRLPGMPGRGFGLTAFVAIDIPESER